MSLPECLENAASALPALADQIRPANGDPRRLLDGLAPGDAARVLAWVLDHDAAAGEELLEAWSGFDGGASVIAGVAEDAVEKAGRKLLRRARHRLRARGIALAEPTSAPAAAQPVRRGAVASDRWQAAHLSAPDFRGTRMGYLVDDHPAGGARLFETRFDPARGILDFKIYNAGRSKVRGFLKSLMQGTRQRLFEIDPAVLRGLVRRASLAQPADRALPTMFVEWRGRLFSDALEATPTPGALAREALGVAADAAASLDRVDGAIRTGRIGPWPPVTAWVAERMERARKAVESLAGEARAGAIAAWREQVTEELGRETGTGDLAELLAEWAWIDWQRGEDDEARALLAVSHALASASGADARRRLADARIEALFGPFLAALSVERDDQ
ncbi:MAG: hypothetical protein R3F35_01510 [Myxococcota bacterium]